MKRYEISPGWSVELPVGGRSYTDDSGDLVVVTGFGVTARFGLFTTKGVPEEKRREGLRARLPKRLRWKGPLVAGDVSGEFYAYDPLDAGGGVAQHVIGAYLVGGSANAVVAADYDLPELEWPARRLIESVRYRRPPIVAPQSRKRRRR